MLNLDPTPGYVRAPARPMHSGGLERADLLLLAFRAVAFAFCAAVMIRGVALDTWFMAAFTIWNYTTLVSPPHTPR